MKQNITLSLDKELLHKARILAATRETSVSRLLADELRRIVHEAESYERVMEEALNEIQAGFHFGGRPASRDQVHER